MARHKSRKSRKSRKNRKNRKSRKSRRSHRRQKGGMPITYDCGGGIRCAEGRNTVVTYKGNEIDSVPTFVSKLDRDEYHERDLMPE